MPDCYGNPTLDEVDLDEGMKWQNCDHPPDAIESIECPVHKHFDEYVMELRTVCTECGKDITGEV
jgi:hypothetical protein